MGWRVQAAGLDTTWPELASPVAHVTSSRNADVFAMRVTSDLTTSPNPANTSPVSQGPGLGYRDVGCTVTFSGVLGGVQVHILGIGWGVYIYIYMPILGIGGGVQLPISRLKRPINVKSILRMGCEGIHRYSHINKNNSELSRSSQIPYRPKTVWPISPICPYISF